MNVEIMNINDVDINTLLKGVSASRIERSQKFKNEVDRRRSLCVEYLLNQMITKYCSNIPTPVSLTYDEAGKPHIYCNNEVFDSDSQKDIIHFSLSHSGEYVACMIDSAPCGVDIEVHKEKDFSRIAKRICSEKELCQINSSTDFYNIWTLKESVLKATGLGLSLDMKSFEFSIDGDNNWTSSINGHKYTGKVLSSPAGYSLSYVRIIC